MARNPKIEPEAEAAVDKALDALDPALAEALRAHFRTLRAEISRLSATVADIGRTGADAVKDRVAGAQAAAGEKIAEARAQFADTRGEVEAYAREKPVQAMGIAAGLGLLVGLLLARR